MIKEFIEEALKKGKGEIRKEWDIAYFRLKEKFKGWERGTVLIQNRLIPGYPRIKRVVSLKGLKHLKGNRYYVEEKIDGYNIRVVQIKGKVMAFSRGGFFDAFATENVERLAKFFEKHPNTIICGEMIGNTPHTPSQKKEGVKFYVFDVYEEGKGFWEVKERRKILSKMKITQVPLLGVVKSKEEIEKIVLSANREGKEGVVIKDEKGGRIKYVCAFSDINDIHEAIEKFFDMPAGFFYQRMLRSAIFFYNHKLPQEEYAKRMGEALLRLVEAVKRIDRGEGVEEEYYIEIKSEKTWKNILAHMSKEVEIEEKARWRKGGKIHIRFVKKYPKTTEKIRKLLGGKAFVD